jgi:ATP-dependent Clp protease protease subunit
VANLIVAQFLHLQSEAADKDISLYINSPGGDMTALFAIHDTMQFLNCDVATYCVGQAASAAAVLLAAGAPGKRHLLANARVLLHQPHGGAQGQSTDMEIAVREMVEMRRRMIAILSEATGQTPERIAIDIDRDYILRGEAAIAYGVVDHILEPSPLRTSRSEPAGVRSSHPSGDGAPAYASLAHDIREHGKAGHYPPTK